MQAVLDLSILLNPWLAFRCKAVGRSASATKGNDVGRRDGFWVKVLLSSLFRLTGFVASGHAPEQCKKVSHWFESLSMFWSLSL